MLLLDNSAWARLSNPRLLENRAEEVASWIEQGELAVCLPFLLEAGYSARSGPDHAAMIEGLKLLPRLAITPQVEQLALEAQAGLARIGHHRIPPTDLVIAACAHLERAGVLHYDRDYDLLATGGGLDFQSVWLATPGSI